MPKNQSSAEQGLPDFFVQHSKTGKRLPNNHKIYQMVTQYAIWPENIPTSSIASPSKIYPNLDFWFENVPSGNPVTNS
jgi:hypothetical protein